MPKLFEGQGRLVISPHSHHTDDTSPHIGGKLGRIYVIEVQYSPNIRVNWESQVGMENSLITGHIARASRHYGLIILEEPGLDP